MKPGNLALLVVDKVEEIKNNLISYMRKTTSYSHKGVIMANRE